MGVGGATLVIELEGWGMERSASEHARIVEGSGSGSGSG